MHATLVTVTLKDLDAARASLESDVVPRVKSQPGFVAGYWLAPRDGRGFSVVLWDSEENASAAAEMVRSTPPEAPVTIDDVEVREVIVNV